MNSFEKKILEWIERHLYIIIAIVVTVMAIVARCSLSEFVSGDARKFLLPWYYHIEENGLYSQIGDYNLLYQFMIWLMTRLPIKAIYSYKILSCAFDFAMAIIVGFFVHRLSNENKNWNSIIAYSAVLLCPTVFLNSAAWAQCDVIYSAFAVLGIYLLDREQYNLSLISLGVSFAFKLHAVFVLPIYLFVYFKKRRFSLLRFTIVPATMLVLASPLLFWGRNILDTFSIYASQTKTYPAMAKNYPSAWLLFCKAEDESQYMLYKTAAIIFTVFMIAVFMVYWIREKYDPSGRSLVIMTFLLAYTTVLFLPAMHERYGFIYEILGIILAILIPKTIPLCAGLIAVSLGTYGGFLCRTDVWPEDLTWTNFILYVAYVVILTRELKKEQQIAVVPAEQ